jgi:hypothetical protein
MTFAKFGEIWPSGSGKEMKNAKIYRRTTCDQKKLT